MANDALKFAGDGGLGVFLSSELRLVAVDSIDQEGGRWAGVSVMVVKTVTGFLKSVLGTIRFVNNEIVIMGTVKCDMVFVLDVQWQKDVGNAMGMKPHCAVSWKITNLVGAGDSSISVDLHCGSDGVNVLEQAAVHEDISSGLVVE